tara:strand:- start:2859 stop:3383 length:525 start_codon:yes stop_codon:yes gene_type:complete
MLKLKCNDESLYPIFTKLFEQKNLVNNAKSDSYYAFINILVNKSNIILEADGKKINLSLPININNFYKEILIILSDIKLSIHKLDYFPYQRFLLKENKKSFLSDIQNTIISSLIISKEGINKEVLYKFIWRKDKVIAINKLDTHLSNLKNQLKKDLNVNINFQSKDKFLRLLIN